MCITGRYGTPQSSSGVQGPTQKSSSAIFGGNKIKAARFYLFYPLQDVSSA
jgi:hypothetical protein